MGSLAIPQNNNNNNNTVEETFLSCLVLPEKDPEGRTQRLVLGGAPNEEIEGGGLLATLRTKQRFGDALERKPSGEEEEKEEEPNAACTLEEITRIVRCKMPGEQPWMLQRAKWDTLVPNAVSKQDNFQESSGSIATIGSSSSTSSREPLFWVTSEPLQDFYERLGTTASNMGDSGEDGIVVQSGFACPNSKTLRLLARQYRKKAADDVPALCGILRIEGKVRFGC